MITWTNTTVKLADLVPWEHNPRTMTKRQAQRLLKSWRDLGQFQTIAIGPDCEVYDGHQRLNALLTVYGAGYEVAARQSDRPLDDDERGHLMAAANIAAGAWDWDKLAALDAEALKSWGFDDEALRQWNADAANLAMMLGTATFDQKSLDELQAEYGETGERDFWPVIKVQVSPETEQKYKALMATLPGADEAEKFDALVSRWG